MIKITKISYTCKTVYYGQQKWDEGKIYPFRINFVRDGLHYSLNVSAGNYSDKWHTAYLHCKETKDHKFIDVVDSCTLHDYVDPNWKVNMPYSHYNPAYLERLFLPNFREMVEDRDTAKRLYRDLIQQRKLVNISESFSEKVPYILGELDTLTERLREELDCNPAIARTNSSYPFCCKYRYSIKTKDGYVVCGHPTTSIWFEGIEDKENGNLYLAKESEILSDIYTVDYYRSEAKSVLKEVREKFNSLPNKEFYIHVDKIYRLDDFSEWRNVEVADDRKQGSY